MHKEGKFKQTETEEHSFLDDKRTVSPTRAFAAATSIAHHHHVHPRKESLPQTKGFASLLRTFSLLREPITEVMRHHLSFGVLLRSLSPASISRGGRPFNYARGPRVSVLPSLPTFFPVVFLRRDAHSPCLRVRTGSTRLPNTRASPTSTTSRLLRDLRRGLPAGASLARPSSFRLAPRRTATHTHGGKEEEEGAREESQGSGEERRGEGSRVAPLGTT